MKKCISLFLTILLAICLLPAAAVAAEESPATDDGLVLYTSFDEATIADGKYTDLSGNGNDGLMVGAPTKVPGIVGDAVFFDNGSLGGGDNTQGTQYVNFGQNLQFGTGDFSISFWLKTVGRGQENAAIISNKNYASGGNPGFAVGNFNNSGQKDVRLNMNTSGAGRSDIYGIQANDDEWRHVVAVFNRSQNVLQVYLDGSFNNSTNISGHTGNTLDTGMDLVLGASGTKCNAFSNGAIDELRIYNKALGLDSISRIYQADGYTLELERMQAYVDDIEPNVEFTAEAIDAFRQTIQQAGEDIANSNSVEERLLILSALKTAYQQFLKGSDPLASFFMVSDVHVDGNANATNSLNFATALQDMKALNPNAIAFISDGDQTDYGSAAEVGNFYNILNQHNPVAQDKVFVTLGNHDVRGSSSWTDPNDPDNYNYEIAYWDTAYSLYMQHNGPYMPETNGKVYFDRIIGGYHFIALNTERALKDKAYISQEQLDWLESRLEATAGSGKPIFVMLHQPLPDTVWRSNAWDAGDASGQLKEIFAKYPQVIFSSGHIHNGFGVAEAVDREYGTMLDLPSFSSSENGYRTKGIGYYVKIYESAVVFKARNFVTGAWLPEYDITVNTPSLPVVYKQATSLVPEDYTAESWAAVAASMANAQEIFAREYEAVGWAVTAPPDVALFDGETRARINEIAATLQRAIDLLEPAAEVDKGALQALYDSYKDLEQGDYTVASWESFQNALQQAANMLAHESATQEQVDSAAEALQLAYEGLREQPDPGDVEVESVKINLGTLTNLKYGKTLALAVTINPEEATDKTLVFASSNSNVLTVDRNGNVTGVKPGTARVTATAHNGVSHTVTIRITA